MLEGRSFARSARFGAMIIPLALSINLLANVRPYLAMVLSLTVIAVVIARLIVDRRKDSLGASALLLSTGGVATRFGRGPISWTPWTEFRRIKVGRFHRWTLRTKARMTWFLAVSKTNDLFDPSKRQGRLPPSVTRNYADVYFYATAEEAAAIEAYAYDLFRAFAARGLDTARASVPRAEST